MSDTLCFSLFLIYPTLNGLKGSSFFQFLVWRNGRLGQPFQSHLGTIIQLRLVSSQAFLDVQLICVCFPTISAQHCEDEDWKILKQLVYRPKHIYDIKIHICKGVRSITYELPPPSNSIINHNMELQGSNNLNLSRYYINDTILINMGNDWCLCFNVFVCMSMCGDLDCDYGEPVQ